MENKENKEILTPKKVKLPVLFPNDLQPSPRDVSGSGVYRASHLILCPFLSFADPLPQTVSTFLSLSSGFLIISQF